MTDRTPTTEEVRYVYASARLDAFEMNFGAGVEHPKCVEDAERFGAWLATVRREAAALALEDAAGDAIPRDVLTSGLRPWLRERASAIRNESKETS